MFFTPELMARNSRLRQHWDDLWAHRGVYGMQHNALMANSNQMNETMRVVNAGGAFGQDFWKEIDNQVVQIRGETTGMEILDDLMAIQTVLPVGKTAKLYSKASDISDDVSVSLDGQAPYTFDNVDYGTGGDPIPVFSAGFGVNWREAAGLSTVGIDKVLDSQSAKLVKYNKKLVAYLLDGDKNITVENYKGMGLRNHTNTQKVNLNAVIDLTTADQAALDAFFVSGAFGATRRANFVDVYDVAWVSPEVMANLEQPYVIGGQATGQTVADAMKAKWRIKDFKESYALSGNELLAYQRRQSVVSPLVGMATGVVALPRPLPNSNFNFQILGAMGIQVKADDNSHSGVIYAADLG